MRLFIQLPCLNEAEALPITLAQLPRRVDGFDEVKWLVINDGSTDATEQVAYDHGVDYVSSASGKERNSSHSTHDLYRANIAGSSATGLALAMGCGLTSGPLALILS